MTKHKHRSLKSGLPPGTLVHLGERKIDRAAVSVIEYGPDELVERGLSVVDDERERVTLPVRWINVHGLHEPEVMAEIGQRFKLHPLVLEDILNTDQRPKVDDYGDYLYIVARFFDYDAAAMTSSSEQVSLVVGDDFVLSFQERPTGSFSPLRERLRQDRGRIRRLGADYLAYALLDVVVDRYFAVLEQIGEHTDRVEDELMHSATPALLQTLHQLKRETLALRRAVWPLREVLNTLARADTRFFKPETLPYLRDVYDHTVHVIESLEAIRDVLAGMLDIYLSSISNRVNQEVRVLTVIALIFMPATLISGIFGMNFRTMPLLDNPFGFFAAIGLMTVVATTVAAIFWRRRWLG
jgi:magnesium transporter